MEWNFKLPDGSLDFGPRKGNKIMPRPKADDPFNDEEWGMPESSTNTSSSEMPDSDDSKPPFIKPHHVGGNGKTGTLELVRVTSETSDYSDVILLVNFKGKKFRLGLRTFSEEYQYLLAKFGKKPTDWHGSLRFKAVDNHGKPYVSVRP